MRSIMGGHQNKSPFFCSGMQDVIPFALTLILCLNLAKELTGTVKGHLKGHQTSTRPFKYLPVGSTNTSYYHPQPPHPQLLQIDPFPGLGLVLFEPHDPCPTSPDCKPGRASFLHTTARLQVSPHSTLDASQEGFLGFVVISSRLLRWNYRRHHIRGAIP